MSSSAPQRPRSAYRSAAFHPDDASTLGGERVVSTSVSPLDRLVVLRVVAIIVLAVFVFSFGDGADSVSIGLILLGIATIQPLIALLWRREDSHRQAQLFSDLIAFVVIVSVAPEYYWMAVIGVAALLGSHAVAAPLRDYVPAVIVGVGAVISLGFVNDIDQYERAAGVVLIMALGHGAMAWSTRKATVYARQDLLSAISAVGGLAYLVDLSDDHGVVDVLGDVEGILGWTKEEWITADHRGLIHPDDIGDFWLPLDETRVGDLIDRTARIRRSDGNWIWMRDMSRVVLIGKKKHLRGFSIDVTAQQDGLDRVTTEVTTDSLTGLRNRRWLMAELDRRSEHDGHHLVLIDLNRFKDVNDTLGHDAGDELLRIVADRLVTCLRPTDVIARLGGDEFAIVVNPMADPTVVMAMMDRIAWEIARPVELNGVAFTTSLSAGVARADGVGCDATSMLRQADIAMYTAKRTGRIAVFFDSELEEYTDRRTELSRSLSSALENGDLLLHFQPIVDVETGAIAGMEGLARWQHADYGLLRPDSFLEVILLSERAGDFTREMVRCAIATAARLDGMGHPVPVAVNLPIRTVEDAEFERWFVGACESARVAPAQLVFEIAERDIHDNDSITVAIDRLAALGVTISVDDFGAGHATFERLRWRNVDQLKLDRGVMNGATTDAREQTILRSVLSLATELGYQVVAEGVEREDQLELLRRFGCAYAQGYLFGRPVPFEELVERFVAHDRPADGDALV